MSRESTIVNIWKHRKQRGHKKVSETKACAWVLKDKRRKETGNQLTNDKATRRIVMSQRHFQHERSVQRRDEERRRREPKSTAASELLQQRMDLPQVTRQQHRSTRMRRGGNAKLKAWAKVLGWLPRVASKQYDVQRSQGPSDFPQFDAWSPQVVAKGASSSKLTSYSP